MNMIQPTNLERTVITQDVEECPRTQVILFGEGNKL